VLNAPPSDKFRDVQHVRLQLPKVRATAAATTARSCPAHWTSSSTACAGAWTSTRRPSCRRSPRRGGRTRIQAARCLSQDFVIRDGLGCIMILGRARANGPRGLRRRCHGQGRGELHPAPGTPRGRDRLQGAARFCELALKTEPRIYFIASSPRAVQGSLDLCVGVVKYETDLGMLRRGLCSTMISGATQVLCKICSAPHVHMPDDATAPMACVCGGTGIAPFLGFLEERCD